MSIVLAAPVPGTELLSVRARIEAAQRRVGRRPTDRERRAATAAHERLLRGEWVAGRLTRAQCLEDLRPRARSCR
jgi:hypothetical protein